jgi:hypothetical protein
MEYLVLQKNGEEAQVFSHENVIFSGGLSDAKKYIEKITILTTRGHFSSSV